MYLENRTLDVQGHRGCRGLYPENSIPAFLHAMSLGVNTLEMDVVVSKDNQVIVSHEPYMSHNICLKPDGNEYFEEEAQSHNIFRLTYEEIKKYDCGSKVFGKYPLQKKVKTYKPSLKDLVNETEKLSNSKSPILYNIEIKRKQEWDTIFHPTYKVFADLVIAQIIELGIAERTTIQCFDIETLKYLHESYPDHKLVYLIANEDSPSKNIEKLGFMPHVYSPYFKLIDETLVKYCREHNTLLIPWTVNDVVDMKKCIDIGVDGIITDYPDKLLSILED